MFAFVSHTYTFHNQIYYIHTTCTQYTLNTQNIQVKYYIHTYKHNKHTSYKQYITHKKYTQIIKIKYCVHKKIHIILVHLDEYKIHIILVHLDEYKIHIILVHLDEYKIHIILVHLDEYYVRVAIYQLCREQ